MTDAASWSAPAPCSHVPVSGRHVHLIGIGGAGMRGLAGLLLERGLIVSGSDRDPSAVRDLPSGVRLDSETDLASVCSADLVVYSSAVADDHPKLVAARKHGIASEKRATILGALLNDRRLIGVSGTHGKTTVTAMTAIACEAGGLEPTALVGGQVPSWRGSTLAGSGDVVVVEADEFDRSFLQLDPSLAIATSIEPEHLECYGSFERLVDAYAEFASRAATRDGVLVCADDPMAVTVGERVGSSATYGFDASADWRVQVVASDSTGQSCRLESSTEALDFRLGAPGRHNAQNAAAALVAALRVGADQASLGDALAEFRGVERRLQVLLATRQLVVVDDYAHHPTEVIASIEALRAAYPAHRLLVVFQPHLFSRTRDMATEFGEALGDADEAIVLPVYPSRESPIPGVTADLIVVAAAGTRVHAGDMESVSAKLGESPTDPTVVAFMGAGDVTHLAHRVADRGGHDEVGA